MTIPNKFKSLVKFSSEMDFSLLASDMQKLLHISPKINIFDGRPAELLCNHTSDIKKVKTRNCAYLEDIEVHKCPLCPMNFNSKDLLARHALRVHHKAVVVLLQDGSTDQHLKCRFCVHKVMHRHQKLLLLHLEKKHAVEFVSYLKQSWMPSAETRGLLSKAETSQGHKAIGYLQEGLEGMALSNYRNFLVKDTTCPNVNKAGSQDTICCSSSSKPKNSVVNMSSCSETSVAVSNFPNAAVPIYHSYAKRKLILDGTSDCQSSKAFVMKENVPPEEPLITTLAGSGWKHATGKHFACGRCKEAFSCNALLLDHVSVRHRGPLRLLQPLFTCGLCSASFYKNSFLVRHCYQHHTPK